MSDLIIRYEGYWISAQSKVELEAIMKKWLSFIYNKVQVFLPHVLLRFLKIKFQAYNLPKWEAAGRPVPPPHLIKVLKIQELAKKNNIRVFVETGTYMGDMIECVKNDFDLIISIELSIQFFKRAKRIFKRYRNILLLQGDSGMLLSKVCQTIKRPAIFWLDAHYSGGNTARGNIDTPIISELRSIFTNSKEKNIVVIDDARCFVGEDGYPTVKELKTFCKNFSYDIVLIKDDGIILKHQ